MYQAKIVVDHDARPRFCRAALWVTARSGVGNGTPREGWHRRTIALLSLFNECKAVPPQAELVLMFENLQDAPITPRQIAMWSARVCSTQVHPGRMAAEV